MFSYDINALNNLLANIIQNNVTDDVWKWLSKNQNISSIIGLNLAFATTQRKTGKALVNIDKESIRQLNAIRPGFKTNNWTIDRLSRVWLLLQLDATDKEIYHTTIESLFLTAEMNELVALYSALPLLCYPELWVNRCAEGIRSNIGIVLESIMYHNPYPAEILPEPAWNQLVVKAIFTEKQLNSITGLHERNNRELARILLDYARERRAAGRNIEPMLWQLVARFSDTDLLNTVKHQYITT